MLLAEVKDRISVIITFYKHNRTLSYAIESVLSQVYKNIEVILVNNNALPESLVVAKTYRDLYPERIKVVYEPTQGIASARNRGIIESTGEFITFCDEDDVWREDKLQRQLEIQKKYPECSMVTNLVDFIDYENGSLIESGITFLPQFWAKELFGDTEKYKTWPLYNPHPSTMFFRKKLAFEVGLFDEAFNPYWTEDTEFSLRMYEKGPIYLIPESLTFLRRSPNDYLKKRQGDFDFVAIKNLNYFFKILCGKLGNTKDSIVTKKLKKIRVQWMREISITFFVFKDGKAYGRFLLMRALSDDIINLKTWKVFLRTFLPQKLYPSIFKFEKIIDKSFPPEINHSYLKELFKFK